MITLHLVTKRPWPLITTFALIITTYNIRTVILNLPPISNNYIWTKKYDRTFTINFNEKPFIDRISLSPREKIILILVTLLITLALWWRDVHREASIGHHYLEAQKLIKIAIIIFILREVMFFFGFFWSYYWYAINNKLILDNVWPPAIQGIQTTLNPYRLALINCFILLSSGVTITFAHFAIIQKKQRDSKKGLTLTIILALMFLIIQIFEYNGRVLNITSFTFGSIFFTITGLHGSHVFIGLIIIIIRLIRTNNGCLSNTRHLGTEITIWYWHFVDVVWLFVYVSLYWWVS